MDVVSVELVKCRRFICMSRIYLYVSCKCDDSSLMCVCACILIIIIILIVLVVVTGIILSINWRSNIHSVDDVINVSA